MFVYQYPISGSCDLNSVTELDWLIYVDITVSPFFDVSAFSITLYSISGSVDESPT